MAESENGRKEKQGRKGDQMRRGIKEKSGRGERSRRKEGRGWRTGEERNTPIRPLKVNSIDSHIYIR